MVVDFFEGNGEVTNLEEAEFVCAFHYPTMMESAVPLGMSIRTDPAPNWTPHPNSQVPFYIAHGDRLLVITFTVWSVLEAHMQTLLFVRTSTLLSHVEAMGGETKRHLQWDEWGPSQTRMMRAPRIHSSVWVCYVFGLRFVTMSKWRGKPKGIEVYDFRLHAGDRRTEQSSVSDGEDDEGGWMNAETQMPGGIFSDEVATSLPYQMRTIVPAPSEGKRAWESVMLSEDTIIIMGDVRVFSGRLSLAAIWLF